MERPCITEAECTECDDDEASFRVLDTEMDVSEGEVTYNVACSCGEHGVITVDPNGTTATDLISYENASWMTADS